jgi:hypothetical protein
MKLRFPYTLSLLIDLTIYRGSAAGPGGYEWRHRGRLVQRAYQEVPDEAREVREKLLASLGRWCRCQGDLFHVRQHLGHVYSELYAQFQAVHRI